MPSAKQLLAKLVRFFNRIKPSTTPRIIDDKQQKKSRKAAGEVLPLNELGRMPLDKELQPAAGGKEKEKAKRKNRNNNNNNVNAEIPTTTTSKNNRMEAGHEDIAVASPIADLNEGPILDTGITRVAFCRKLDSLLQRSLGVDACHGGRRWPKANGSYC
ncbi:hypothetical protein KR215_009069 [Drosophila sulfurigaster]|nr:hypothetical protein KR215_009069 [Drosophila sulfurigaster]